MTDAASTTSEGSARTADRGRERMSRLAQMLAEPAHRRCYAALATLELAILAAVSWSSEHVAIVVAAWSGGVVGWTLVEYLLHRVLFHLPRTHPLSRVGARHHLDHHDAPRRAPITKPLHLTLPAIAVAVAVSWWAGPVALAIVAGLVAGYLCYELLHVAAHVLDGDHAIPSVQRWHLAHHDDRRHAFGITSPVWDHVLRSAKKPR